MAKNAEKSTSTKATKPKAKPKAASRAKSKATASKPVPGKGRNLVVVESPAKGQTINRYLGKDYIVKASMGHVRDLPKREMGVDVENHFAPTYTPLVGRKKVLAELKKYAKAAPMVYLATDLDREGEAIAWHVAESLNLPPEKIRRVVFNEITAAAIREAFDHPMSINMDKVNAQQARRVLDRIVGYELSPLLWKKVAGGLSAGRVQTVTVRLIVEREREIEAFMPQEYWKISAIFTHDLAGAAAAGERWAEFLSRRDEKGNGPTLDQQQALLAELGSFRAELVKLNGKRFKVDNSDDALAAAKAVGLSVQEIERTEAPDAKGPAQHRIKVIARVSDDAPQFTISRLDHRRRRTRPPAPFTTATLQQAAAVTLRFSASRTMRTAQKLYEGISVPGEGHVGLITYMRTDSTHLSRGSIDGVRKMIAEQFGENYLPDKPNIFASGKRAQEAHEAIRTTDATRHPDKLMGVLDGDYERLYRLIWRRFVACQMTPALWKIAEADIVAVTDAGEAQFKAMGRKLEFDGFMKVAGLPRSGDQLLPELGVDQPVAPLELDPSQHFTQPPPRYTEASLVKALEAEGIGRPSTYAAIIRTIQDRRYVEQISRAFHPTDLGCVVVDKLVKHFPKVFDVHFTAQLEDELDKIEEHQIEWQDVLKKFYEPFSKQLIRAREEMVHAKAETEPSEYVCPDCGAPMEYRFGKNGRFLSCTKYPDCKKAMPINRKGEPQGPQLTDVACPKCSEAMAIRRGRFGPFLSCSKYPDCDGIVKLDRKGIVKAPTAPPLAIDEIHCPNCESSLNLRRSKRGPWLSCTKYPKCRGRVGWKGLPDEQKASLEQALEAHEQANPVATLVKMDGTAVGDEYKPEINGDDQDQNSESEGES